MEPAWNEAPNCMSKKKDKKPLKRVERGPGNGKAASKSEGSAAGKGVAEKAKPIAEADHERMDGIAERLRLGAQAFRADVDTLLKEVRKGGVKPSTKARKILAAMAKEYRKASKGLKKLSSKKG